MRFTILPSKYIYSEDDGTFNLIFIEGVNGQSVIVNLSESLRNDVRNSLRPTNIKEGDE